MLGWFERYPNYIKFVKNIAKCLNRKNCILQLIYIKKHNFAVPSMLTGRFNQQPGRQPVGRRLTWVGSVLVASPWALFFFSVTQQQQQVFCTSRCNPITLHFDLRVMLQLLPPPSASSHLNPPATGPGMPFTRDPVLFRSCFQSCVNGMGVSQQQHPRHMLLLLDRWYIDFSCPPSLTSRVTTTFEVKWLFYALSKQCRCKILRCGRLLHRQAIVNNIEIPP